MTNLLLCINQVLYTKYILSMPANLGSSLVADHAPTHPFLQANPNPNPTLTQTLTQGRVHYRYKARNCTRSLIFVGNSWNKHCYPFCGHTLILTLIPLRVPWHSHKIVPSFFLEDPMLWMTLSLLWQVVQLFQTTSGTSVSQKPCPGHTKSGRWSRQQWKTSET